MNDSLPTKERLIDQLTRSMAEECAIIASSLANAVDGATNPESKPEGKYDTRALEASYLAGAQQERLRELRASLEFIRSQRAVDLTPGTAVTAPALITIQSDAGELRHVLLVAVGGGITLQSGRHKVQVVTPSSPLGAALLGKRTGDFASWGQASQEWELIAVR